MKFRLPKQKDFLRIQEDFVSLLEISKKGLCKYRIKYEINLSKIFRQKEKPNIVRLKFSTAKPEKRKISIFEGKYDPGNSVQQILSHRSQQKSLMRKKGEGFFKIFYSDFTKKIPNDLLVQLTKIETQNPRKDKIPGLPKQRKIVYLTKQQIEERNIQAPILNTNLFKQKIKKRGRKIKQVPKFFAKKLSNLLLDFQIDPAMFSGLRSNTIIPTITQANGNIPNRRQQLRRLGPKFKNRNFLRDMHLSDLDFADNQSLPENEYIGVIMSEESIWLPIEEIIEIPIGKIDLDSFLVIFELVGKKGFVIEEYKRTISHGKFISFLSLPIKPPNLVVSPIGRPGKNILKVSQIDQNANEVHVYKRIVPINEINRDAKYTLLETIELNYGEAEKILIDEVASSNPVVYRAIAANSGILGGDFVGAVAKTQISPRGQQKHFRRHNHLSLTHEMQSTSITLFINNVSPGPIALSLHRKDLTIHEQDYTQIGTSMLLNSETVAAIQIKDDGVKPYRIYEYQCRLIYEDGAIEIANNNMVIEFTPLQNNIINVETTLPNIIFDQNTVDVNIQITKDIILKEADITKAFLEEQGLFAQFEDDIKDNKEKLQSLFFIQVMRFNLLNGQIEDFGIIDDLNFFDKKFGKIKNVSPLSKNGHYKYAFIAYSRDPETLLETISRDVTTSHGSYSLVPYKWYNPITLSDGNIVTDSSLKRNHAHSAFSLGKVVDIKYVEVDLRKNRPRIYSAKVSSFIGKSTLIRWKIRGEATLIDHFIIVLETMGMRTVIGKAHNITFTNEFQVVDTLDNGEGGQINYLIIPVYFDYSRGRGVRTNRIII